ncbi:late competence development ComFB family protein [Spirochaetota bacterium]
MSVVNLMKYIVNNITDDLIRNDKDLIQDGLGRDDIIAYVLNRVPPMYVTSERGMLYGLLEDKYSTQQKSDIMFLIYEAIDIFKERRIPEVETKMEDVDSETCRFSHVIGQVLEESTLTVIDGAEVSMYFGDELAVMFDSGWKNPYITKGSARGYYHFWPLYDKNKMGKGPKVHFKITVRHPNCVEKTEEIELELLSEANLAKSNIMPIVLLEAKNGKLDFLYEDGI